METKPCKQCKENFTIEPEDFSFYEKMGVPAPAICPTCRFKWRSLWRNEMTLYNRKCDATGESIISMYNPKRPYKVYSHDYFTSDKWDPRDYAKEYDISRPFFDQLKELLEEVPKRTTYTTNVAAPNINSDYTNYAGANKNCYMCFNSAGGEEMMYSRGLLNSRDAVDIYLGDKNELCYECVAAEKNNKVVFGQNVVGCVDSWFLENCSGCTHCLGCVNLRNGSYQFFNEQLSKEEYEHRMEDIRGSYSALEEIKKKFLEHRLKFPMRTSHNLKTINSSGDCLSECKNVHHSFEISKGENSKFLFSSKENIRDSYGTMGYGFESERLLECAAVGFASHVIGSALSDQVQNIAYSFYLKNSHDCIGCDSLKNAEYCILNKQYSKEEYEKLHEHIVKELTEKELYGLMMPPEIAPFKYNEAVGQDNFPMTKEEAITQGLGWEDDVQETRGKETLKPEEIPDHIKDVQDSITNEVLACEETGRNYKITPQELQFYRKMNLPIPRKCFFARHTERIKRRGPYKFWTRKCAHCDKEITTNYAPERLEKVFCEECYQQEVI